MSASGMRVRIVGSSSSLPRPGRACSCYLVQTPGVKLLLDLGPGALAKLLETMRYDELDAVVISHMHPDHFLDLVPLRYCLRYGNHDRRIKIPIWLPPGGIARLGALATALETDGDGEFFTSVFDMCEYDPHGKLPIGDVLLSFAKTIHYIDAYAMRVENGSVLLCYSADTAPSDDVVALARGADLFLCEVSVGLGEEKGPTRGHLSAVEAASMAERAGAQRLALTHYGIEFPAAELEDAARKVYRGPCVAVDDGTDLQL
jgi:ribonuclease BN (tRNA processing enzyme)